MSGANTNTKFVFVSCEEIPHTLIILKIAEKSTGKYGIFCTLPAPRHPIPFQASPVEPCGEMIGLSV